MRRKTITIILVFLTISSIAYSVGVTIDNKNIKVSIDNKTEEVDILNDEVQSLTTQKELDLNTISGLQMELQETSDALEGARRYIEKLTGKVDFNHNDVTVISNTTITHMERALEGTALYEVADALVQAEQIYGVNAFFLAAIAAQESGWGTSDRAVNHNNLTGYGVYTSASRGARPDTKDQSILDTAQLIRENYLTVGAISYNGESVKNINKKYCFYGDQKTVDYRWTENVTRISYDLINKANDF